MDVQTNRAKEFLVDLILHIYSNTFLIFYVTQTHSYYVRIIERCHVNKFHITMDIKSDFFFYLFFLVARSEINVMHNNCDLGCEELASY